MPPKRKAAAGGAKKKLNVAAIKKQQEEQKRLEEERRRLEEAEKERQRILAEERRLAEEEAERQAQLKAAQTKKSQKQKQRDERGAQMLQAAKEQNDAMAALAKQQEEERRMKADEERKAREAEKKKKEEKLAGLEDWEREFAEEEMGNADVEDWEMEAMDDVDFGTDGVIDLAAITGKMSDKREQEAEVARVAAEEAEKKKQQLDYAMMRDESSVIKSGRNRLATKGGLSDEEIEELLKGIDSSLRSPICVVMGHVDVGKTKVLDKIRATNVQGGEAGGITQQIGATFFPMRNIIQRTRLFHTDSKSLEYNIPGLLVIDTPGHESFTNLRSRGSSLCDIAILVIDIMHGIEPQTIESLELLKKGRTPFVIALNKIDRLVSWEATEDVAFKTTFANQKEYTKDDFEDRLRNIQTELIKLGFESELYYKNKNLRKVVNIVPTSGITGEGIPDLLALTVQLTQKMMAKKLKLANKLACTVLEVKRIEGHGTTIDVILSDGILKEGDQIVVAGMDEPIVTNIRALLTPRPMKEIRVKDDYMHHKEIRAAMGVKIAAAGLEEAVAGSSLRVVGRNDDIDELCEEVQEEVAEILEKVSPSGLGVYLQASTLGSMEALLEFFNSPSVKIPVSDMSLGTVHSTDVKKAALMLEKDRPEYACICAFDVDVSPDAREDAEKLGVTIFTAPIIYHLFDSYTEFLANYRKKVREAAMSKVIWPAKFRLIDRNHIFRNGDPLLLGVRILGGCLHKDTRVSVFGKDGRVEIGVVTGIKLLEESLDKANPGQEVSIRIDHHGPNITRHFDEHSDFYTDVSRASIDAIRDYEREWFKKGNNLELTKEIKELYGIK